MDLNDYNVDCGLGLFSNVEISIDNVVAEYHGTTLKGKDEMR